MTVFTSKALRALLQSALSDSDEHLLVFDRLYQIVDRLLNVSFLALHLPTHHDTNDYTKPSCR